VLTDDDLTRLLKVLEGAAFEQRRDVAIVRLLIETGMRRSELAGLKVGDLDWEHGVAVVLGMGARLRSCPFGAKTARALDRCLRALDVHKHAAGVVEAVAR
jgi:site-specific recombinase XerD